ncbi:serine/threonine protein phosphatase [Nonlabens ulvanivorans]|nr:metallophosphoesterase family protein [Nonlabens ulvanivorans]GAK92675.1 serine/threonine protein phosphatase [Nonlabens ulvanivorans]
MRTIAIGDIHGGYKALEQLLDKIDLQDRDLLIFLGDYIDGWSQSFEVIEFLISLKRKRIQNNQTAPIYLRGNHDELFLNYLKTKAQNSMWLHHGGQSTIDSYKNRSTKDFERHVEFFEKGLKNYYIDKSNNGFFHAGFHNLKGPKYDYYDNMPYWDRTLWELALCLDPNLTPDNDRYPNRLKLYKEIFIGHTPTSRLGKLEPINAVNVWNIDTAAAYKGPLTAICVQNKEVWQSDPVHTFYPGENGRN